MNNVIKNNHAYLRTYTFFIKDRDRRFLDFIDFFNFFFILIVFF